MLSPRCKPMFATLLLLSNCAFAQTNMVAGQACTKIADDGSEGGYVLDCPGAGRFRVHAIEDAQVRPVSTAASQRATRNHATRNYWDFVSGRHFSVEAKPAGHRARAQARLAPAAVMLKDSACTEAGAKKPEARRAGGTVQAALPRDVKPRSCEQ